MKYFQYTQDEDGIGTLLFDTPNSSANVFSNETMNELNIFLKHLEKETNIKALFIQSAKNGIFIAGADIHEIKTAKNKNEVNDFIQKGQNLFNKLEELPFPVIALIDGMCLGGGLELALACSYRIATSQEHTRIGFPEVNLGILPGFGGTQRLSPLVGYTKAIELIVGAKLLKGEKALHLGLVDACVPKGYLGFKKEEYIKLILEGALAKKITAQGEAVSWYEHISFVRDIIGKFAKKKILQKTKGNYPAPLAVIDVMQKSFSKPLEEGLKIEREAEIELVMSPVSKNLTELFLIAEELKHDTFSASKPKKITHTAVVGTGTMGSGIAWLMNYHDMDVRLKVRSYESAARAIKNIRKIYTAIIKRHRLDAREVNLKMDRVSFHREYVGFNNIEFLIEAVNEDILMKQDVYQAFEKVLPKDAVIASNTSSISISSLAETLQYPHRFIGMHFFNPANKMPLVEIIAGEKTDEQTVSTVVSLAKELGKTPIKIKDSPGFLVNRVLLPYIKEAVLMFEEGLDITLIDEELLIFGMPMGPFELLDTVGIDVGASVSDILYKAYGERMIPSEIMQKMLTNNWLGKKTQKGFYSYDNQEHIPNKGIYEFQQDSIALDKQIIVERAILIMINEASRCLEEKVVSNARYLDMAMVMGTGFPAFRGGLLRYADSLGIQHVTESLQQLYDVYGERFKPSQLLEDMAQKDGSFYGDVL